MMDVPFWVPLVAYRRRVDAAQTPRMTPRVAACGVWNMVRVWLCVKRVTKEKNYRMNYIIWRLGPFTRQATSLLLTYIGNSIQQLNAQRARSSPSCNKAFNNQQMKNTAPNTAHIAHSQKWPKNSRNPRSPPASPPLHVRASRHLPLVLAGTRPMLP